MELCGCCLSHDIHHQSGIYDNLPPGIVVGQIRGPYNVNHSGVSKSPFITWGGRCELFSSRWPYASGSLKTGFGAEA